VGGCLYCYVYKDFVLTVLSLPESCVVSIIDWMDSFFDLFLLDGGENLTVHVCFLFYKDFSCKYVLTLDAAQNFVCPQINVSYTFVGEFANCIYSAFLRPFVHDIMSYCRCR
jgi:hypothetical protein